MQNLLMISQVIITILLSIVILTQNRSAGLSSTFGGSGGFYTSKRGAEKVLHNITIGLSILFVANSLAFLFV